MKYYYLFLVLTSSLFLSCDAGHFPGSIRYKVFTDNGKLVDAKVVSAYYPFCGDVQRNSHIMTGSFFEGELYNPNDNEGTFKVVYYDVSNGQQSGYPVTIEIYHDEYLLEEQRFFIYANQREVSLHVNFNFNNEGDDLF